MGPDPHTGSGLTNTVTPQLEIHDWDDDFVRLATAAKLAVFSGSNALVASPLLLKAQDPLRKKPMWASDWDSQRTSLTDYRARYEPTRPSRRSTGITTCWMSR
jgi:hypothetical protein